MPCQVHADVLEGLKRCSACWKTFCQTCLVRTEEGVFCAPCKEKRPQAAPAAEVREQSDFAGIADRFMARILDGLVIGLLGLPIVLFVTDNPTQGFLLVYGAAFFYEVGMLTWRGQTLGKMALRIRVMTADGNPIGLLRAFGRTFINMVMVPPLNVINLLPSLFMPGRTCFHDIVAQTRVIKTS